MSHQSSLQATLLHLKLAHHVRFALTSQSKGLQQMDYEQYSQVVTAAFNELHDI